jgi:hypothetical protein
MARRKPDTRSPGVVFTKQAADRIASAVRSVERGGGTVGAGHWGYRADESDGLKLSKTNAAWLRGSKQTLTIYDGNPGSETAQAGQTVDAWNYVADLPSGVWVLVGYCNASYYLLSFDFEGLANFSQGRQQVLGHAANAGLSWINTTNCP